MSCRQLTACLVLAMACGSAMARTSIMSYQAKLINGNGAPVNSTVNMTFTFWDAPSGGNQVGNGFSDTDLVTPNGEGVCSTDIGDDPDNPIPALVFSSDSVWLNVEVNGSNVTPRARIDSAAYSVSDFPLAGPAYIIVAVTTNAQTNGTKLIQACARAKALTPHGQPLSAGNRATVLIPPGNYDLAANQIVLDAEFVDIVGLTTSRANQYVFGITNGSGTGVIRQTANDVRIENLLVECIRSSGDPVPADSNAPSAYFPDAGTTATVVRNCEFKGNDILATGFSMRPAVAYPGTFTDCVAGFCSFGGSGGGEASGTFTRCKGEDYSFGGFSGIASGTFTDCIGRYASFGGFHGTASGTFTNCAAGPESFSGEFGHATGAFYNCTGGDFSFAGGGTATGTFTDCIGTYASFGGHPQFSPSGNARGIYTNCHGGDESFGGGFGNSGNGKFFWCTGGNDSFTTAGNAATAFLYCLRNGAPFPP